MPWRSRSFTWVLLASRGGTRLWWQSVIRSKGMLAAASHSATELRQHLDAVAQLDTPEAAPLACRLAALSRSFGMKAISLALDGIAVV